MKKTIDRLIVILPFEKEYYKKNWDWDVDYVGHPLIEEIENSKLKIKKSETLNAAFSKKSIIALLPGSRKQEISKKLPVMLEVSKSFPEYQFIIAKAPGLDTFFYDEMIKGYDHVSYVADQTYELLMQAKAALVTSGTATLETALFEVPEVVCYKGSWLSYQLAKRLVKIKYISLVNLIMDKEVVKELIQNELTVENVKKELQRLLNDEKRIAEIKSDYAELIAILHAEKNASETTAKIVYSTSKA